MSVNHPPVVQPVSNQVVDVGQGANITNVISDTGQSGSTITGVSVVGSPPGVTAYYDGTNVIVNWSPTAFQAGTTNVVQLIITNSGVPPLTTTQTFVISIPDYVQAGVTGSTPSRPGDGVCLPLSLFTSIGLTNVNFEVTVPPTGFTNWSITLLSSALCNGTVTSLSETQLLVNLTTCPGQSLLATGQNIANLCLNIGTNQPSQFLKIPISAVQATETNSAQVPDTEGSYPPGRLVVVGDQPLLDIQNDASNGTSITLYGIPNTTNTLQATPALTGAGLSWQGVWTNVVTNLATPITISTGTNQMFFRVVTPP
jgi:hypothetical protein